MRVLWVDADENPWTDANGWRMLDDFGIQVQRCATVPEAQAALPQKNFDLVLVRAELSGAPSFLVQAHRLVENDPRRLLLVSSEWSKEQFRAHSKTGAAAHRYARVPMPPEGLLNLFADLFGCAVEELAHLDLSAEQELLGAPPALEEGTADAGMPVPEEATERPAPAPRRDRKGSLEAHESGDLDVVRKYLAIREDQLDLAEAERDELSGENERLRREAQALQLRLRELEHQQEEIERKLRQAEEEKSEGEKARLHQQEEAERNTRLQAERLKGLEAQLGEAGEKYESLRSRVRKDIRKIRENERELEARLELNRKDSATLLAARDEKVLDLQRKIDALEFDLDQVQDGRVQAQMEAERYLAKLSRVARALQIGLSMIEADQGGEAELEELEPLAGGAANAEEPKNAEPAAGAEPPPAGELPPEELSPELAALASEGEATQMISAEALQDTGGEPGQQS